MKAYLSEYNPCPAELGYASSFANSVDPDQLASEEANWSGSALFAIQYVSLYQQLGQVIWLAEKLEMGMASELSSAWQVFRYTR